MRLSSNSERILSEIFSVPGVFRRSCFRRSPKSGFPYTRPSGKDVQQTFFFFGALFHLSLKSLVLRKSQFPSTQGTPSSQGATHTLPWESFPFLRNSPFSALLMTLTSTSPSFHKACVVSLWFSKPTLFSPHFSSSAGRIYDRLMSTVPPPRLFFFPFAPDGRALPVPPLHWRRAALSFEQPHPDLHADKIPSSHCRSFLPFVRSWAASCVAGRLAICPDEQKQGSAPAPAGRASATCVAPPQFTAFFPPLSIPKMTRATPFPDAVFPSGGFNALHVPVSFSYQPFLFRGAGPQFPAKRVLSPDCPRPPLSECL